MRLIDADRVSEIIYGNVPAPYEDSREAKEECLRAIEEAPTIDAVSVVRCAECKHLLVWNTKNLYASCPKANTIFLPFELDTRMHFCSLGEKKDGTGHIGGYND